ncbi:amidase [Breoghania sp.]|uniref:amidase n=1 Tax=Breoghania sp. TaxID=2065378 RepID=UPI002AAC35D9|nr:amidase [Breoghania sp.]
MNLASLGALDLSALIHDRKVSCAEVMEATLSRIDRLNPKINAVISLRDADALMDEARVCDVELAAGRSRGWLHGIPVAVKDLADTKGLVTTQGSPLFARHIPLEDDAHVARMRADGALIIGKTNTPEFGLGSHSYNPVFGVTRNPWDTSKTAGGSSGGAGAALAMRLVAVADGSDMMGSLRNPAAFNNIVSLRPTFGRVPALPSTDVYGPGLATDGPMGRSVADVAALFSTLAGYDPRAPQTLPGDGSEFRAVEPIEPEGLRIGWLGDLDGYLPFEPGILDLCRDALNIFSDMGCVVEEARPGFAMDRVWRSWTTLRHAVVASNLKGLHADPAKSEKLKPEAIWEIENGLKLSASDVFAASTERTAWLRAMLRLFARYDYLVLPSAQVFPFPAEWTWPKEVAGRPMDTYHRWMEVVVPVSLLGLPTLALPAGFGGAGLPMGFQLIAPARAEKQLLALGAAYEAAIDWLDRVPDGAE